MSSFSGLKYQPPFLLKNGHIATIYSGVVDQNPVPFYQREKWELPDGDFLLVDFQLQDNKEAVILCHGLEGHSQSNYNNAAAHYFIKKGYTVFAWNNRSCGGEINRLPQLYHHGTIKDLIFVIQQVIKKGFEKIYLMGFSLGGTQILNYLGKTSPSSKIKAAVAFSTPFQLECSIEKMKRGLNVLYANRFIRKIKVKLIKKANHFPQILSKKRIKKIKTMEDLTRFFLVPIHNFKDSKDYYLKASPGNILGKIRIPTLIINALNDPILGKEAYKIPQNPFITLQTPTNGGHCSFIDLHTGAAFPAATASNFFSKLQG